MASRDEEEQEARGFKVQDRRRFVDSATPDQASEPRSEPAPESPPTEPHGDPLSQHVTHEAAGHHPHAGHEGHLHADDAAASGELSFSTFVMGLTTQALMHLGEIPDPMEQTVAHDLPAAKQMIDLLAILRDKTRGNLDVAEAQLLDNMLYDLRMRFVEVSRGR